ncbi:MAG: hypothetical protein M1816_007988 [Peltula sp. TS41687]|nr:MAG: hypothetical protein M1816_007988 [Peltula sp. TS41687]
MFHRRPRTPSNAHINHDPSPSAATAAAQAFLANRASNASLSAAAAAAALRSHTTSPVPVSAVQTKRTVRRQASIGSIGSAGGYDNGRALRRQGSSGSMTDRTFRDQSPSRPPSRGRVDSPPPIPALPKQLPPLPRGVMQTAGKRPATSSGPAPPPIPQKSQRRTSSVEPPYARVASPPPSQSAGRGLKIDTNRVVSPGVVAAQRASGIAVAGLPPRPESRGSVNFSYPISPRSPTPSMDERRSGSGPGWDQQSPVRVASPVSSANTVRSNVVPASQGTFQQAPKPAKKKKKPAVEQSTSGRQFENAGMGGQAAQKSVNNGGFSSHLNSLETPSTMRMINKAASPSVTIPDRPSSVASFHSDLDTISEDGDVPERPTRFKTRAAALLVKHPSVVRENRELEERAEAADRVQSAPKPVGSPQVKQTIPAASSKVNLPAAQTQEGRGRNTGTGNPPPPVGNNAKSNQPTRSSSQPAPLLPKSPARRTGSVDMGYAPKNIPAARGQATGRGGRQQSLSPTRYAHFAASPPISPLVVKHEPPPRSVSPAKSAMRKSPSPRPNSAASRHSTTGYTGYGRTANDPSDTSMNSEDGGTGVSGPKKKNARVSFDEESIVIGEGGENPIAPNQSTYRKGTAENLDNGTDDILTPTPALPSFGSLRGRKDRDDDNRMSQPSLAPAPLQTSSDHAIGAFLMQNPSKSDEADDVNSNTAQFDLDQKFDVVPSIEFTQPTPNLEQTENVLNWNIAAANPENPESLVNGKGEHEDGSQPRSLTASPALAGLAEPEPEGAARNHSPGTPTVGHFAEDLRIRTDTQTGDNGDDDDQSSVYSDAAEDLSQVEGDGFGSIDAVVDSPVESPTIDSRPGIATTSPPDSPTSKLANGQPEKDIFAGRANGTETRPNTQEGWDQTQAYWSSVSGRQKQESERTAAPSASDKAVEPLKPLAKKKKKVTPTVQPASQIPSAQPIINNANTLPLPMAPKPKQGQVVPASNKGILKSPMSLRSQNVNPSTQLPKTMRGGPAQTSVQQLRPTATPAKNTLRSETGDLRAPRRARPESTPDAFSTAVQRELRNMNAPPLPTSKSPVPGKKRGGLRRTKSSDSDSSASSSSFRKKSRPVSTASGGAVALRRTMRAGSQSEGTDPVGNRSSRFSMRSLSPAGSTTRRTFSPQPPPPPPSTGYTNKGTMKMSLRGSQGSSMPTLRSQSADHGRPASTSFTGFGRTSKPKGKPLRSSGQQKQRSRRFSDSSDEGMPTSSALPTFRSRFRDDSSDDEEATRPPRERLAPVRGIPRRIGEEDRESSDLPDSSDDERRRVVESSPKVTKAKKQLESSGGPSTALAVGSLRHNNGSGMDLSKGAEAAQRHKEKDTTDKGGHPHKKRRSFFFAALGGRRHQQQHEKKFESVQDMVTAAAAERRRQTNEEKQPVGEDEQQQQQQSMTNGLSTPPTSPRPRLSKRNSSMAAQSTAQRIEEDEGSWPIPAIPSTQPSSPLKSALISNSNRAEERRPTTSDGVPPSSRGRGMWGVRKHVHLPHHGRHGSDAAAGRTDLGRRRVTVQDPPLEDGGGGGAADGTEAEGAGGEIRAQYAAVERRKKKRFGALRRAFGLLD